MRTGALFVLLLASCGGGPPANDSAAGTAPGATPVQVATPTGLYEATGSGRHDQLCIVANEGQGARFGLVSSDGTRPGCSGAGSVERVGGSLRLVMAGDERCTVEARTNGATVAFPAALPAGCAYYCAPGTSLAGLSLAKTGGTAADALRARDLVGDALCAG
jgi:hypothetical protein